MATKEPSDEQDSGEREKRQRKGESHVRGAVKALREQDQHERRHRSSRLKRDERVDAARAHCEPATRRQPEEKSRCAPEPGVHGSSGDADPGKRSCTSASPDRGTTSITRRFGARDGATTMNARRPASTARSPPAGNSIVRNLPRGLLTRAERTRQKSGTTRASGFQPSRSQRHSTRNRIRS